MTPSVVTHRTGLQFHAQLGTHQLIFDQPVRAGGGDAGPSPLNLIGAALGGCVALYIYQFLETRRLRTDGLRVEVEQHTVRKPHRIDRLDVHIAVPDEVPAFYEPLIEAAARVCPVYNTLSLAVEVTISVEFSAQALVTQ